MSRLLRTTPTQLILSITAIALLTSCAPPAPTATPTSTPASTATSSPDASATSTPAPTSRPALADLALSSEGLGTLRFGQVPESDPVLSMVAFDPIACTDAVTGEPLGIVAGDPLAGAWVIDPSYVVAPTATSSGVTFGVGINASAGDVVTRIDLYSSDIPTDGGVRIGDDRADVIAAHPGATLSESALTDIYVVSGATGLLQIEVASRNTADSDAYWASVAIPDGRVLYIHAVASALGVFSVAASGNIVGGCNFG